MTEEENNSQECIIYEETKEPPHIQVRVAIAPYSQVIHEIQEEQVSSSTNQQNKSSSRGEFNELTNMSNNHHHNLLRERSSKKRLISIDSDAVGVKFVNVSSRTSFKGSGDHTKLIGHSLPDD